MSRRLWLEVDHVELRAGDEVLVSFGIIIIEAAWTRNPDGWKCVGYTDSQGKWIDVARHPGHRWEICRTELW